jgi:hypothetical protein
MPRNGSGTYTKAGSSFVNGATADATDVNAQVDDIATALTGSVAADGQTAMTGNLAMGTHKLTGLAAGTTSGDSLRYEQVIGADPLAVTNLTIATDGTAVKQAQYDYWIVACSDETTALTSGTAKVTFHAPYAATLATGVSIWAGLTTAQTAGNIFTVDVNEAGVSLLSTKITIDNNENTSQTAATPAVVSDFSIAGFAAISVDIDQIGTSGAKGLKVYMKVSPT